MSDELDLITLVKSWRKADFVAKMQLKPYQRYFLNKFNQFHLSRQDDVKEAMQERIETEATLQEGGLYGELFEDYSQELKEENPIDRRIVYELTGKKLDPLDDFEVKLPNKKTA